MDGILLVIGVVTVNSLTFDCRWYVDTLHGNRVECASGQQKVLAGAVLLFICQGILLLGILIFLELERKRVTDGDRGSSSGGPPTTQLEVRQMAMRPMGPMGGGMMTMGSTPNFSSNNNGWGEAAVPKTTVTTNVQAVPTQMQATPMQNQMTVSQMKMTEASTDPQGGMVSKAT